MVHLVAARSKNTLHVFDRSHSLARSYVVGTDAWGNHGVGDDGSTPLPPWGHDCWMPIGHYVLGPVDVFDTPIPSEGFGQIPVRDLSVADCQALARTEDATFNGMTATIGGIEAEIGQLEAFNRSGIMIHCGGSNSPDPLADTQGIYRTFGCSRMLNADWKDLASYLTPLQAGNTIVYTALETPADLGQ